MRNAAIFGQQSHAALKSTNDRCLVQAVATDIATRAAVPGVDSAQVLWAKILGASSAGVDRRKRV